MGDPKVDQQLVERAQRGDKRAFVLLAVKYKRKLVRLLSQFIHDTGGVEDVTRETFIKAYRTLPTFRADSAFYTWLYRIGVNTAKNHLAANGRRTPIMTEINAVNAEGSEAMESFKALNTPESELASRQIAESVSQALQQLPDELRTAITLREIDGLSYEEIAQIMNCPTATVRSCTFSARDAIAQRLQPHLDAPKGMIMDRISAFIAGEAARG